MKKLNLPPIYEALITDCSDGNFDPHFSSKKEVSQRLKALFKKLNSNSSSVIQTEQVHGTKVVRVGKKDMGSTIPVADGMVTNEAGIWLMLRLADCFPIMLFDEKNNAIGLLHSGWRGTV